MKSALAAFVTLAIFGFVPPATAKTVASSFPRDFPVSLATDLRRT